MCWKLIHDESDFPGVTFAMQAGSGVIVRHVLYDGEEEISQTCCFVPDSLITSNKFGCFVRER